jgi:hypothetical protein
MGLLLPCVQNEDYPVLVVQTTDGGLVSPHFRVSAGSTLLGNAIDIWRLCLCVKIVSPLIPQSHTL